MKPSPYDPPLTPTQEEACSLAGELGHERNRRSAVVYGAFILLAPAIVAIFTVVAINAPPLNEYDERYLSLYCGVPPALSAIAIGLICWRREHPLVAAVGTTLWLLAAGFNALVTIGFWDG